MVMQQAVLTDGAACLVVVPRDIQHFFNQIYVQLILFILIMSVTNYTRAYVHVLKSIRFV